MGAELSLGELERQVKKLRERIEDMNEEMQKKRLSFSEAPSSDKLAILKGLAEVLGVDLQDLIDREVQV